VAISDTTTTGYTDAAWHLVVTAAQDGDEVSIVANKPVLYAFSAASPVSSVHGIPREAGVEFNAVLDNGNKVWFRAPSGRVDVTSTIKRNV
jgi:hypothetical protein